MPLRPSTRDRRRPEGSQNKANLKSGSSAIYNRLEADPGPGAGEPHPEWSRPGAARVLQLEAAGPVLVHRSALREDHVPTIPVAGRALPWAVEAELYRNPSPPHPARRRLFI